MRFSWIPLLAATVATVTLMGACAGQGEGEVCDPRAGNAGTADCRYPFVCTNASELSPGTNGDRCCPSDRSTATGVCAISQAGVTADSAAPAPPVDGATGDAADGAIAEGATSDAADGATADGATADETDSAAPGSADSATADAANGAIADGPNPGADGALVDAASSTAADAGDAGD